MHQCVIDVAVIPEVPIKQFTEDRVQDGIGDNVRRVEEGLCVSVCVLRLDVGAKRKECSTYHDGTEGGNSAVFCKT